MSARVPEEIQAAMLYEIMNQVMRSRDDEEEEDDDDNRVQCPVCSKFHEPREGEEEAAKKGEPASHGCLVVYIAHQCPICLGKTRKLIYRTFTFKASGIIFSHPLIYYSFIQTEDPAGPPMIAMPCGHLVCQPDFEKLGGFLGEKPSNKPSESRSRRRSNRNDDGPNVMDPAEFISGLSMMRMMGGVMGFPPGFMGDDEDDDEEEEEESDDESCPPLERVGGGQADAGNDSDDDSMPPLERVGGGQVAGNDSDDDSMPALEHVRNAVESDNEEAGSDTSSMPPLMPRGDESDEEEKNDSDDDMPLLAPRSRTGRSTAAAAEADSDEDMPSLTPRTRTGDNANAGRRPNNTPASIPECPPLERADLDSSDDEDDNDITIPPSVEDDSQIAAGEISEIDSGDESEDDDLVIPFPVLERVRGASTCSYDVYS